MQTHIHSTLHRPNLGLLMANLTLSEEMAGPNGRKSGSRCWDHMVGTYVRTIRRDHMVGLNGVTIWREQMAGGTRWWDHMAEPGPHGRTTWKNHLAGADGRTIWRDHMPGTYGGTTWHDPMPRLDGGNVWWEKMSG